MSRLSRRTFLKQLAFVDKEQSPSGHTLVCVFLRGGADTLNMFVPYGDDAYYRARPTLAIPAPTKGSSSTSSKVSSERAIALNDFYGLHPRLQPLMEPFKEGSLAVVQGVGTDNTTGSHFEAQDQMEHGERFGKRLGGGWLGRHLRFRKGGQLTPLSAVSIGKTLPESLRGAPSASALSSVDDVKLSAPHANSRAVADALSQLYGLDSDLLGHAGSVTVELLRKVERLQNEAYKPANDAVYPNSNLGRALKEVARLVKAGVGVEVACVDHDGWDTHFFQGTTDGLQAGNIDDLGKSLGAFYKDTKKYSESVTTIVITEFGRRVYENSSMGTDHGRGFALLAMGSKVNGGRVLGDWPGLKEEQNFGASQFLGPSGLSVAIDYRSVLAELLEKLLNNNNVAAVFPDFSPQKVGLIL